MNWQQENKWREQFGTQPTESEAVLFNMITELTAQSERRLQSIQDKIDSRQRQRVYRLTEAATKRAQHKVKAQMAAKVAIIERFKHTGPSKASITAVIKDPVYRFTAGIANSHLAQKNTGQDK